MDRRIDRVAGVVDEDVDPAPFADDVGDELVGNAGLGQVAGEDERLAVDLGGGLLRDVGIEVVDQHLRALRREQLRGRPADPAGRAGDDRHLAIEDSHCIFAFRLRRDLAKRRLSAACGFRIRSRNDERRTNGSRPTPPSWGTAPPTDDELEALLALAAGSPRTPPSAKRRRSRAGWPPAAGVEPEQALRLAQGAGRWLNQPYDDRPVRRDRLHRRADRRIPGAHAPPDPPLGAGRSQPGQARAVPTPSGDDRAGAADARR